MADVKDPKRARRFNKDLIPPAVTTEYINAIGMMFSLAALLMKVNVQYNLLVDHFPRGRLWFGDYRRL